jgi:hypothetical protein
MPFVLATICTVPFTVGLGLYAIFLMSHKEQFINYVVLACMFGWPVLAPLAIIGLIFIVLSWIWSPHYCRLFLIFYALFIIGFVTLGYFIDFKTSL